ncbi:MAG TPA: hypothetical protein VEK08_09155 [Planctomycetota bacterium]|nr:hypothetical protein [Planctomycetota bacterium]
MAWYAVDAETRTPLSLLELQTRQRLALSGEKHPALAIIHLRESEKHVWKGLTEWPPFMELRLIPRSNFLEAQSPLPLNQGMRGWFWSGHVLWSGEPTRSASLYDLQVYRRGNFEWSLNTVQINLEALPNAGEFRVHVDTHTPGLAGVFVKVDNAAPAARAVPFTWKLHSGRNQLEVFTRNSAGRDGPASSIELEQP